MTEETSQKAAALIDHDAALSGEGARQVGSSVLPSPGVPQALGQGGSLLALALGLHRSGRLAEAEQQYAVVLQIDPENAEVLSLIGTVHFQRDNPDATVRAIGLSLERNPSQPAALALLGHALSRLKRYADAVSAYERAIALKPNQAAAHSGVGNALLELNRSDEALASYDVATALRPNDSDAHYGRGNALRALQRHPEAVTSYDKAIEFSPDHAAAYFNRARTSAELNRTSEAAQDYDKTIAIEPHNADAHRHGGDLCRRLGNDTAALALYDNAIMLRPDYALAHRGRAQALRGLKRFDEAIASIDTAIKLNRSLPYARGDRIFTKLHACRWDGLQEESAELMTAVGRGELVAAPLTVLALTSKPEMQRRCSELYTNHRYRASTPNSTTTGTRTPHRRIRVAYISSGFRVHPGALLMAGVFEQHDRGKFESYALSISHDDGSAIRNRLMSAFEHFIDVREKSDEEVAALMRDCEIDIAVDLRGYLGHARSGVLALRPAPIQVSCLGFAGTMGASFIDYIIADKIVIPVEDQEFYSERVVYLPDTYQCNDSKRQIAKTVPTRAEVGLPSSGFVFCSFNDSYKIRAQFFDIWMRLLTKVEGSVIWLLHTSSTVVENLRREAESRGVDPARLVFAPRLPNPEHLARHRLADLFLDTLPSGAHTTASDALWAGLPVLTCMGTTFPGRVGASLLHAVGLPELVTHSLAEYEARALALALDPAALAVLKAKLARNRETEPLFDTVRFTRHLEAAYAGMWERYESGHPPASFAVEAMAAAGAR